MELTTARVTPDERSAVLDFLVGNEWPFHERARLSAEVVESQLASGWLMRTGTETFWVTSDGARCGLLRLFDLDDGSPLFDLRLAGSWRGRGVGTATVRWLTHYVFAVHAAIDRIEATTRVDNLAMRRALLTAGWAKESHWRRAWMSDDAAYDGVGYAVLRDDHERGLVTPVLWND